MREVVAIRAVLDRLAERDDIEAEAHIESMARSSRNALLEIIGGIVGFVCASLIAAMLVLRVTNPYRRDLLRETIEALPAGVVLYDNKERLVMFNSLADEISPGADLAKSIGRTYAELAAENGRKLEAMGQGPQPVDEWVARFRARTADHAPGLGRPLVRMVEADAGRLHGRAQGRRHREEAPRGGRSSTPAPSTQSLVDSLTVVFKVDFYSGLIIFANARPGFLRPAGGRIVGRPCSMRQEETGRSSPGSRVPPRKAYGEWAIPCRSA